MINMDKIKAGDKVRIIGKSRVHHCLAVPSTAEVVDTDFTCVKVFGYGYDGMMYDQWVSFVDIKPVRKAVVL